MSGDSSVKEPSSTPVLTEERARELMQEGEKASREYRERVENKMWAISKDARQTRAR
jgi:hypothetical protein